MREETGSSSRPERGQIARGSGGAGPLRRLYRRSPLRRFVKVTLAHRGLSANDIFFTAYPRSGSAYLRWLIVDMITGETSFPKVRSAFPYVGEHRSSRRILSSGGRLVKTHEQFLPVYRRAIHLVRDPRDVAISYFHFLQRIGRISVRDKDDEQASFDRHIDAFIAGRVDGHGTWQEHLNSWLAAARDGSADIFRLRYEDLRADTPAWLIRVGAWMGHELDAERAALIVERCSLERMRAAEDVASGQEFFRPGHVRTGQRIVREGRVGGWRELLTEAQQVRFAAFADGLAGMGYEPARSTVEAAIGAGAPG